MNVSIHDDRLYEGMGYLRIESDASLEWRKYRGERDIIVS